MPALFDYHCDTCDRTFELIVDRDKINEQVCPECGGPAVKIFAQGKPEMAFNPHYSSSLGEHLESRQHRKQVIEAIYERSIACKPLHERKHGW